MLERLKGTSWWRFVVALFLVPVVLVANQGAAAAATVGRADFTFPASIADPGTATCQIPWKVNAGGVIVGATSRCDGGVDWSPGYCQPFEGACGAYGLVLKDNAGGTCGSTGFEPTGGGSLTRVSAVLGAGYVSINWPTCTPIEACLSFYMNGFDLVQCVPVDITPPVEETPTTCQWGTVTTPATEMSIVDDAPPANYILDKLRLSGGVVASPNPPEPKDSNWTYYAVVLRGEEPGESRGMGTYRDFYQAAPQYLRLVTKTQLIPRGLSADIVGEFIADGRIDSRRKPITKVLGFGVYRTGPESWAPTDQSYANATGSIGRTDPGRCQWYWGVPIAEITPDGSHEPIGPIPEGGTEEPTDEEPPPVDVGEPLPEGFNWLAAIFGAIGKLINAITALVGNLLEGLGKLLIKLFVPDPSSWKLDQLHDQVTTKPPFSIGAEVGDALIGTIDGFRTAGGSCGNLFPPIVPGGDAVTCSAMRASTGNLYTVVQIGLLGTTAFILFNLLSTAIERGQ